MSEIQCPITLTARRDGVAESEVETGRASRARSLAVGSARVNRPGDNPLIDVT